MASNLYLAYLSPRNLSIWGGKLVIGLLGTLVGEIGQILLRTKRIVGLREKSVKAVWALELYKSLKQSQVHSILCKDQTILYSIPVTSVRLIHISYHPIARHTIVRRIATMANVEKKYVTYNQVCTPTLRNCYEDWRYHWNSMSFEYLACNRLTRFGTNVGTQVVPGVSIPHSQWLQAEPDDCYRWRGLCAR